jgi:uncharacterized membrane protein (DUF485 family)
MEKSKFVSRGGIWVALQAVLLLLILLIPIYTRLMGTESGWGWPLGSIASMIGVMSLVIGVIFIRRAFADLGDNNLAINNTASGLGTGAAAPLNALTPFTSSNIQGHTTGNLVRAGVNYHLSLSPSAIVAKY